jgi:hypothetical protein
MSKSTTKLEDMTISEMVLSHIQKELDEDQVKLAQDLVVERMLMNQCFLNQIYVRAKNFFLGRGSLDIKGFTNYYDYFKHLHNSLSKEEVEMLNSLPEEQKAFYKNYENMFEKNGKNKKGGLVKVTTEMPLYLEAATTKSKKSLARHILVRRKDPDRIVCKVAERLLERELGEESYKRNPKKGKPEEKQVAIDDIFGIKIVASSDQKAIDDIFPKVYPTRLQRWGLIPDQNQKEIKRGEVVVGYQPPGVDNHYLYGRANLIQIKGHRTYEVPGVFELDITDVVNMIVDEMEHLRYRQRQKCVEKGLKQSERRRFKEYIRRGDQLFDKVPERRGRIIQPGSYF